MIIKLPPSVAFPVTVSRLLKQPSDSVARLAPILVYTYRATVTEYPEFGTEIRVEKELSEQFDAPVEGRIERWLVRVGTVVESHNVGIVEIEEPCSHEIQYSGLCGVCGKDMTELDYNWYLRDKDRATIQLAHDNTGLTVSEDEARRFEEQTKRRLLKEQKLSLVVDLDQTIIHATVDPTVGEWKDDPTCVNHASVKDVEAFRLEEDISGGRGTWYYVKMRPGLKEFLERISKLYELHIYTMGTRAYAMAVKKIVDPDGTIFGERVLSRDESGSMTSKSLARLFPVDTKMVVIIDDRGDVWKWSDNLVKVKPYDFFVGIGDINSMFLPKKQEFPTEATPMPKPDENPPALPDIPFEKKEEIEEELGEEMAAQADEMKDIEEEVPSIAAAAAAPPQQLSTIETLITMSSGDDRVRITDQKQELDKVIEAQKEDRPLARKQEEQDKKDEEAAAAAASSDTASEAPSEAGAQKHSVLHDDDNELLFLESHLSTVHQQFFEKYERDRQSRKDRVSQLKKHPRKRTAPEDPDGLDLSVVPDVTDIMPFMKRQTLSGVVIVFSGVIPLGANIQYADIALWAKGFGAQVIESISPRVTHVVAARTRTHKVREAARYPHIKIVTPGWLYDSFSRWKRVPEDSYLIAIHPDDRHAALSSSIDEYSGPILSSEDSDLSDDSDDGWDSSADRHDLDMSNVGWKDVDEEFAEFFGDDGSDDDDDDGSDDGHSVKSERTDVEVVKRKRPESAETTDSETESTSATTTTITATVVGSRLAKRQKIARDRADHGSGLKIVEDIDAEETAGEDEDFIAEDLERELFAMEHDEDDNNENGDGVRDNDDEHK